jgi:hypothetical protein
MIAEIKAEFPLIENLLQQLSHRFYYQRPPEYHQFRDTALSVGILENDFDRLIELLFDNQYLIGVQVRRDEPPITSVYDLNKSLRERRFYFLKNKVYLILNPMEHLLKNKEYLRSKL